MPKVDGLEVLRTIKSDPNLKTIPVVILTSSNDEQDVIDSYESGANAYLVKPVAFHQFVNVVQQIGQFWTVLNHYPQR
jgi:CheY-like chemotaxis protein